jgi:YidC/Oxa1 family membrane protein insertase
MSVRGNIILIGLLLAFVLGWMWIVNTIWPPPPPKPKPEAAVIARARAAAEAGIVAGVPEAEVIGKAREAAEAGIAASAPRPGRQIVALVMGGGLAAEALPLAQHKLEAQRKAAEIKPPPEVGKLIAIGHGEKPFYLQALLNTRGGSVQQVVLTQFAESDREGLEVQKDGKSVPLHLVPGVRVNRAPSIRAEREEIKNLPELKPGAYDIDTVGKMSYPSFMMFHYERPGDDRPVLTLGSKNWDFLKDQSDLDPNADEQKIVFQTELNEPYFLRITKTYTLRRREYHLGLKVDIKRLEGKNGPNEFRYQLTGANGLPIEGEWNTTTYRQAIVGFGDERGKTSRYIEDAASVRVTEGGERQPRTGKEAICYAAIAVQYFASAIAVDDRQENRKFIEFVRATPVGAHPPRRGVQGKEQLYWDFLDDLTVRAITETFDPAEVSHQYMLYHGPVKVRLLRQMPPDKAVEDELVNRYLDKIHLDTLTDAPMPNVLGKFANAIYWSNLVIFFTNGIHSLLWLLHQAIPSLGICIIVLTVIVRGLLFPMSRRQAHNAQVMQAKMAKLQPELRKLQEKYGADFQRMNQERMLLYKEHGVNPFAAMGGCFLLLLQMPVMMGLYYALQESVFFRLDSFLWIPNLAAPDMLIFWSEHIPFISTPDDIGSTLYLGPYFNVLPVIAVSLMLYQQVKMMPKSDDPQVQSQQKMMKFMMILFGLFFYKVAAGLCLYFIASSLWGLMERKFMPKPVKPEEVGDAPAGPGPNGSGFNGGRNEEKDDQPPGWWGRKKLHWKEKWKDLLENAQKQQEFRRDQAPQPPPGPDKGKKKKKKR